MNDRRSVQSDKPWWVDKEPNMARLLMAVQRREVILGRDHVKYLGESNDIQNGSSSKD